MGYTKDNPVAINVHCEGCGGRLSGDDVDPYLLELFQTMHKDCPTDVVTTL